MKEIKQFFVNIGKTNIDENTKNLVSDGLIDSLDIMNLINEIEIFYKQELDFDYINEENFESFESIEETIKKAFDL